MERRATLLPTPVATEPPYSVRNELRYFVSQGVPLFAMSLLKMGVPPFFSMVVAGQTPESETLQASLGYARTFYNCVTMMPTMAMIAMMAMAMMVAMTMNTTLRRMAVTIMTMAVAARRMGQ